MQQGALPSQPMPWWRRLFAPVDIASLAVFRIVFGAILFWEVWRYFEGGWIRSHYIDRYLHFKYFGFEWVKAWPGEWMYVHFAVLGVLSLCVMLGLFYRLSMALVTLGYAYWFLLDQTRYLNHLYFVVLLCLLMCFVPAHRARSIDAWRRPQMQPKTAPSWSLWLLRAQVGLVYFYAGVAKLNADWLRGAPLDEWLAARDDMPLIGRILAHEWALPFFGYGGLVFDLLVVPLLLWKPTRVAAFIVAIFFHVMNKWMFDIGIFPAVGIAVTTLFLAPDWPRRLTLFFSPAEAPIDGESVSVVPARVRAAVLYGCGLFLAIQVLVPLRHFLYPGNVHWTEEGHRFSWHMKLRDKDSERVDFWITNPRNGRRWSIDLHEYLSSKQRSRVGTRPDMTLQFAHFLAERLERQERGPVEVRCEAWTSLNGRKPQLLIDPQVDLGKQPRNLRHADWILPLTEPLPR